MRHAPSSRRRYLSVWLRRLPTNRIERLAQARADSASPLARECRTSVGAGLKPAPTGRAAAPLVIVAESKSALRLTAVNDAAARLGLKSGMALADARAMYPAVSVVNADARADRSLRETLADW